MARNKKTNNALTNVSASNYFDTVVTTTVNMDTLSGMRQLYAARLLAKKQAARIDALASKADKASELAKARATKQASDEKNLWLQRFSANLDSASDEVKLLIKLGCGDFSVLNNETQSKAITIIGKLQSGDNVTGQDVRDFIKCAGKCLGVNIVPARESDETISESFARMTYKDYKPVAIRADGKKHVDGLNSCKFVKRSFDDFKRIMAVYVYDSWTYTTAMQILEEAKQTNA